MIALIAIVPWVLSVIALLFILNLKKKEDFDEEDDFISEDTEIIRVTVYKDKAYWVYDNVFYQSELAWEPDFTTASPVDTMSLSTKEVKELLGILDELKEQGKG